MTARQSVVQSDGHLALTCKCWQSACRSVAFSAAVILCIATSGQRLEAQSTQDFLAANIDSTASPRSDFFQFANGAWLKRNPIPDDEATWGSRNLVGAEIASRLRRISETAAAREAPRGSLEQLVGDFWFTGMDSATINRQGLVPLSGEAV
jgi:putative endopeptidase